MNEDELRVALTEERLISTELRREVQGLKDAIAKCRADCLDLGTATKESREKLYAIRARDPMSYGMEDLSL